MKRIRILLTAALAFSLAIPTYGQATTGVPVGWSSQKRANGATTFTPPDLKKGEVYSVTLYDPAALNGLTLDKYLHLFAGTIGDGPGQLASPLQTQEAQGRAVSGSGVYIGPQGARLLAVFVGVSLDGSSISIARILASRGELLERYSDGKNALVDAMTERAQGSRIEAGARPQQVPSRVTQKMKPGGDIVPGVYAGSQFFGSELKYRMQIHLYSNGEYRITDDEGKDLVSQFGTGTGKISYNGATGRLSISSTFDLTNDGADAVTDFCFYGRDAAGKPMIHAEIDVGTRTIITSLTWAAPPTERPLPSAEAARQATETARLAALKAEKKRYKWVVAPGQGLKSSQIETVLLESKMVAGGGAPIFSDEVYLLLRDGTIHVGLPVAPDQLDVSTSRRKEPGSWGRWARVGQSYRASWNGQPEEDLPGQRVFPGAAGMRLQGRYQAALAGFGWHQIWGISFDKAGRFAKDARGGASSGGIATPDGPPVAISTWDHGGSATTVAGGGVAGSVTRPKNPNGDREGTYSIDGYAITLRYGDGRTERMPFFFTSADRKTLWFEDNTLELESNG